jgi:polysaccharide transporter, PST family
MRYRPRIQVTNLLRHTLVQNALSLYSVQIAGYVLPLATIPYLARILGATGWGLLAFTQAFGSYWTVLGEYGFSLSATREVAYHRDNRERLTEILAGVLGAKMLLAAASLPVAFLAGLWIPAFHDHPILLWTGMFWAVAQGSNVMWFFQGFEQMRLVAILDISTRALSTIAIFVFVRSPNEAWRVLLIQGGGYLLSLVIGLALAYRELPVRLPTWNSSREALRMGWGMFLFRGSVTLYTVGNAFILGLFVSPQIVGYYAGAERISRAFIGLLAPVSQTLYPRLSHLVHRERVRAARLARFGVAIMGAGGTLMGVLVFVTAPLLVRIILGEGFEGAIPPLRILSLLLPIVGLNTALGVQWMLPLGLERSLNAITLTAGLINIGLATALAFSYRDLTMAWSVVVAEMFVSAAIYMLLRSRKLNPMNRAMKEAHAAWSAPRVAESSRD